jgi:hypothetical protein
MSREIVRDHGVMLLLGSMRAEERLAAFLLNLTQRLRTRGFSASSLVLRMTREEIGSYLGLKLETVSRTFSKFQDDGHAGSQATPDSRAGPDRAAGLGQRQHGLLNHGPGAWRRAACVVNRLSAWRRGCAP